MFVTKEGSSCDAGVSTRCLVFRFVHCEHGRGSQPGDSKSQEWESATSRKRSESFGDAKGEGPSRLQFVCNLSGTAVGARLQRRLVTADVLLQAVQATTKVATG